MTRNLPYDTKDLQRKDREHVLHPWANLETRRADDPLIVAEADNIYINDTDGDRFIDGIGGMWCVNIGYGRDEMAEAVAEQIRRMPYYSPFGMLGSPPAAELAAKLAELAPGDLDTVFFATGGSTANDSAIRFVQLYFNVTGRPRKKHVITRDQAYHGSTYLAASLCGKPEDRNNLDLITDWVHRLEAPNPYRRPEGQSVEEFCDAKVAELEDKILEIGPDKVAAFIAEPILASGGVIVPPPGYHAGCLEVCRKHDVIYISDEVVTGFGRLGHFFASEPVFDIVPDIITSAKGLTSGYLPLSATLISDAIYEVISQPQAKGALFTHGFTYSGHPVCCAAGLKNIEIMEREDICGHVRKVGRYFEERLATLLDLPIVGDVRGSHFMMCVENVADKKTKALFDPEIDIGHRIAEHCQKRGLIVRPLGHLNVLSPPLVMTRAQVDETVAILREGIEATMDDLAREGLWKG